MKFRSFTVLAGAAVLMLSAQSAQADPSFTPDIDDIVGTGSETTQFLLDDLASSYNSSSPVRRLASFDAVNQETGSTHDIITVRNGVPLQRPASDDEGIGELTKANSTVDFARSSRGERASDDTSASQNTVFIPFAVDELRFAVNSDAGVTALSDEQLTDIYECRLTNWRQLGGADKAIVPLLPRAGSGTRASWIRLATDNDAPGSCVDSNSSIQENDAAAVAGTSGSLLPFSKARFTTTSGVSLGTVTDASVSSGYDRTLYHVVRGGVGDTVPPHLDALFGYDGWICNEGATVIEDAGWRVHDFCGFPVADVS